MANLSITNVCNRKCLYCFASDTQTEYGKTFMSEETFDKALDYLKRSEIKQVRLLGGEPTLHPHFIKFVLKALKSDFDIMLFTNGLMSQEILKFLISVPAEKLSVLLNTIHPAENDDHGIKIQREIMSGLGRVIIPGINIYSAKQDLNFLLEYVSKYNLKKEIRLGISHSVLSQNNVSLHPKEYHKIGYKIALLKQSANKTGITLGFDCGFVPCMFPEEYLDLLSDEIKRAGTCCHPIIDMLTDGSFIACYPLNNFLKIQITQELNAKKLIEHFEKALLPYSEVGIYPFCTTCQLFKDRCNGGCMSYKIQRYFGYQSYTAIHSSDY
jgi:sulfatase maturation enzyme AslB (radical SAM superfamily)